MCVCESCAYLPLYPHKLVWLIPPYLRLHPMCIKMIQNASFHISHICMYIYIHIHTSPYTPTFAHELCQEQAKKTANPFNTGCSCRNCGWVKIWGLNGLSIDTDQTKLGVNRDLTKHCGMFNHRNGIPSGKLT